MTEITLQQVRDRARAEHNKIDGSKQLDLVACLCGIFLAAHSLDVMQAKINAALPLLPGSGPLGEVAVALNDAITMVLAHYTAEGAP